MGERDKLLAAAIVLTFMALACTSAKRVEIRGNDEFADLARGYNGMADAIEQPGKLLAKAEQEKGDLLRNMYPSRLAERVCNGAEVTAETVSNVTVAVALIDGLDMLTVNRSAATSAIS